jgi:hypothetical protein
VGVVMLVWGGVWCVSWCFECGCLCARDVHAFGAVRCAVDSYHAPHMWLI